MLYLCRTHSRPGQPQEGPPTITPHPYVTIHTGQRRSLAQDVLWFSANHVSVCQAGSRGRWEAELSLFIGDLKRLPSTIFSLFLFYL